MGFGPWAGGARPVWELERERARLGPGAQETAGVSLRSTSRSGSHAKWVENSKRALVLSRQAPGWSCTLAAMGMGAVSQPQFLFTTVTWKKSCWMPSTNPDGAAPRVLTVTGGCKHVPWAPLLLCREAGRHSSRPGRLAWLPAFLDPALVLWWEKGLCSSGGGTGPPVFLPRCRD